MAVISYASTFATSLSVASPVSSNSTGVFLSSLESLTLIICSGPTNVYETFIAVIGIELSEAKRWKSVS